VQEPVFGNCLNQFGRLSEDISPFSDTGEVIIEACTGAVVNRIRQLLGEGSVVVNSFEPITVFEVVQESLSISDKVLGSVEALLKLRKLVITGEAEDKASNEVGDSHGVKSVLVTIYSRWDRVRVYRFDGTNCDVQQVGN